MSKATKSVRLALSTAALVGLGLGFVGSQLGRAVQVVPSVQAREFQPSAQTGPQLGEKQRPDGACSNRTLKGTYGVAFSGNAPGFGPFVATAVGIYDGKGKIEGHGVANIDGNVLEGAVTGTYTVKGDCTATGVIFYGPFALSVGGFAVLTNGGDEASFIGTSPAGVLLSGSIKRQ